MVEKMSELGQTSRASTALLKRQEAIKRWKSSDTNREPPHRPSNKVSVTFEKETIFLSAVSGGDLDETRKLIKDGVDINCSNVDGLTGLHQACIDEHEEMVELLVGSGAYLDARDDEGWTPLHAAASAGNVTIAQILIDKGADLLAVNNEGEIPADLAEEEEMDEFLDEELEKLGVEVDEIRNQEEKLMLEDATSWVNSNKVDEKFNFQGASAMHVAAAKGYHKVMKLLVQAGIDVNYKDSDGWTPLHAAIHWGQQQAAEILTEAGADFNIRNNIGQTPCDLADGDIIKSMEELRKKAKDLAKDGLLKKANQRIIDDKGQGLMKRRNDINDNESSRSNKDAKTLQDRSNRIPDSNAKPVKSVLKKGDKRKTQNSNTSNSKDSAASESESESGSESDSETENRPAPAAKPLLSGPLRPSSMTRPSTTATNEKVSTPRNPLIGMVPIRPSSTTNRDNEKRDESKEDSITARLNSRIKQREEDNKKESDQTGREIRVNVPRTVIKNEANDGVASFNIPRPSSRNDDTKKEDSKLKFNIPRPNQSRNDEKKDELKSEERSRNSPLRPTRLEDREEDTKRHTSKADEIRAKFNIPRPGDSAASTALSRFRERRNEETEEASKIDKPDESNKKFAGTKVEESQSSLRARKNPFSAPLRPTKSLELSRSDKPESDTSSISRGRHESEKGEDREETISIRKKLAERREAEKEKENEAEKKEDEDENASLSAQRARRSRRPREKRKATGDEDDEEEKKDTRVNTKANEENEERRSNVALDQAEPQRMSLAERLRKSRENREGLSSVSSITSSRNRDVGSSLTSSKSPGDGLESRDLQRKLRDALNEVEDYKTKLDKVTKEKEELQEKLAQCEEAMKKMKDENGALIRVISTLTRSNSS